MKKIMGLEIKDKVEVKGKREKDDSDVGFSAIAEDYGTDSEEEGKSTRPP